ncbi:MAG: helix-turn-helix transcriptional regulator [Alphaproteobacteria bacterium]|nr:helix-turn-helix transcriptional regulator [Alphaproteobacteria bacterium]MDE2265579.1 helix-turn-helix transcriptional regulator [Alphaproteobacteria bacterium]
MARKRTEALEELDHAIGRRVRAFRTRRGLSQTALGSQLSITFQQVQKYETGTNRVSASRLVEIARVLDVPLLSFLPEAPAGEGPSELTRASEFATSAEGLELCLAFLAISDTQLRRTIVALVRELSGMAQSPATGDAVSVPVNPKQTLRMGSAVKAAPKGRTLGTVSARRTRR